MSHKQIMSASHATGKELVDVIFAAGAAANDAIAQHGRDKVVNGTVGAIMGDDGKIAVIPTVEQVFRALPMSDVVTYAPVVGLPAYRKAAIDLTFADCRPSGYVDAVATPGGTGALHNAIDNYSEIGDGVLTADWFWGPYNALCGELGRTLKTFHLFDESNSRFNLADFTANVEALLKAQSSLLVILNAPAHNPTGYSLTDDEWAAVLDLLRAPRFADKRITLLADIAYLDYAGEKNAARSFMRQFGGLPANLLVLFAFSMSKGYTMYAQRTGALIALAANQSAIDEFARINKYTCRATWSNVNRAAMTVLTTIQQDAALLRQFEAEREVLYQMIRERGAIFMAEALSCGLKALPYRAGFFLSIPSDDPAAVCNRLHDDLIFAVPLRKGVRLAVCSVPATQMRGVAAKILQAM